MAIAIFSGKRTCLALVLFLNSKDQSFALKLCIDHATSPEI